MSRTRPRQSRLTRAAGRLLLLGCSKSKRGTKAALPAIELYDGVNYRVLRRFLNERGWPPGLCIKIVSAKYGLIDAMDLIEPYDQRMDDESAKKHRPCVLAKLKELGRPCSAFVNLGKEYLPAIEGIDTLYQGRPIDYARGPIGMRMRSMKRWLRKLPNATAGIRSRVAKRSYLYIFPDWDDYVIEPFQSDARSANQNADASHYRKYAHELFGGREAPYDGLLVSLAQLYSGKGALSRMDSNTARPGDLRTMLKLPKHLLLFGDCGAFSYASDREPPFSAAKAASIYDRFGFDVGASVDHIPLPEVVERDDTNKIRRRRLSTSERRARVKLTVDNAQKFLAAHRRNRYSFIPMGVIQGIDVRSYVDCVNLYLEMGYRHIALGGLVPKSDGEILNICCAVRAAIQSNTRSRELNVWLHLFGILRPKLQPVFRDLGISSFDSASYLRKAWLRSDQNYLAPEGDKWYSTIRIPISTSKRMQETARRKRLSLAELARRENRCLQTLEEFDGSVSSRRRVVASVNAYGPLLERRGEDNHFIEKHNALLTDQPWKSCPCAICQALGIDVVVFRGAGRNKRRGLHNTWVFYQKVLRSLRKSIASS